MFDCSQLDAARSFFAQLFKTHYPKSDGRTQAESSSPRHEVPAEEKMGCVSVRKSANAKAFSGAEFSEMGKKCVRLAMAGVAVGVLVLGGAQSSQAQTAQPGASVTLVYTPPGGAGSEGAAIDAAGNVYSGTNSATGVWKSTYSNGSYTTANIGAGLTSDYVYALAIDSSGNIYAATEGAGTIIKIVPGSGGTYTATTIITGITGGSGAAGVAVDAYGNIYTNNYGTSLYKYIYSGGTYTQHVIASNFSLTRGLAVDNNGTIYQTDQSAGTVRVFIPSGPVQTTTTYTAGTSFTGLSEPAGVAVKNGIIYIGDNTQLLQETPNGSGGYIQSVAAPGFGGLRGIAPDNSGNIFVSDLLAGTLPAGLKKVTNALQDFGSVTVGTTSTQQSIAFEVITAGTLGTPLVLTKGISGLDFKLGTGSTCVGPLAANTACVVNVTFTPQYAGERFGAVELTNSSGAVIATSLMQGNGSGPQVSYSPGTISTVAGNGTAGYSGDGGSATSAQINADDNGPVIDGAGNLYFADLYNGRVRKVTAATGIITTVAGGGSSPSSCSGSSDAVGDGCLATSAVLSPESVAIDGAGNLYIADGGNERIREVTAATGVITTIAGTGTGGYNGDNIAATTAEISGPYEIAVDGLGNVFISDTGNHRIREVSAATGIITTVAGTGASGYNGDNIAATTAEITNPRGIAVDATDNLYIADYGNQRIRKVSNTGIITTVAGNGTAGYNGDNIAATSAELHTPLGVTVDAAGDLYIADAGNNRVREVIVATGNITTVAGNGTGGFSGDDGAATSAELNGDHALTLDNAGDIYVTDSGNQRIRKVTTTAAPFAFATTYVDSVSADSPQTETITNIGNSALTFEVPGSGDNPAISSGFTIGGSSTCPQLTTQSSAGTLAAGASCTDLISFAPQDVGTTSGSTVTKDNTLNVANTSQSVGLSGTAIPLLTKTITFPQPTTPVTAGSSATLTAYTSNSDPVTYSVTSGAATIVGSTITYTTAGTVVIAANSGQTSTYAAAATVSQTVVVIAAGSSYTAPSEAVGSSSATQTATVNFTAGGTLGAINVVTKGAPNLDFNYVSGGTCAVGTTYTAGEACTVLYSFKPLYPGAREGAAVLETSGGAVLGESYLGGTGTGPLGLFTTTSQTLSISGLSLARGLSTDGYGNLYIAEQGTGAVDEFAAGTTTKTTLGTISAGSAGTAVDGAGNVYAGSNGSTALYELVGGKGSLVQIATLPTATDNNIEVDGAGNLYASGYGSPVGAIYKIAAGTRTVTTLIQGGLGHRFIGMAVDAAGDLFAPDFYNNILYELPFGASSLTTLVTGGALSNPDGVAVDPAGNIYITNITGGNVLRYAAGTYSLTILPATGYVGITIDGKGNLYAATSDSTVAEYTRTTAPGLTFPSTAFGSSSNSLQTVEFENDGNAALAITGYSATTNFNVGGAGNTCATGSLASGASCFVGAEFAPTAVGALSGSASIVDNTLNVAGTSQNIPLSGTATQATPAITWATPSAISYGTALSGTQLNAGSTVAGTYSYNPAAGTVLGAGSHQLSVTLTPTDGTDYTTATSTVMLQVNQATPAITWPTPAAITYGTALSATQLNASSTVAGTYSYNPAVGMVLGAGSYTLFVTFTPTDGTDYTTSTSTVALQVNQATKAITFPVLASPVAVNSTATLAATASNGDPVTYSIVSGAATINGTTITFTNAGTVTIAADSAATFNYLAAATVTDSVVVNAAPSSYTAPTEPVGSTSATQTATVNFTNAGTLNAINVVTQGATGLDYNFVSGGTCAVGTSYTTGQACTVEYSFTPQYPSIRLGAITLTSSGATLLGTSYLGGTGTGPQALFNNGAMSLFQNTSGALNAITTDAAGNVYYSTFNTGNNGVYKVAAGTGITTQLVGGLSLGDGVAIDGAGNVVYTDYNAGTVSELLGGTGTPILIATEPAPEGLAFDQQGNLYVVVSGNQNVVKLLAGSYAPSTTYGTGLAHPQSVAVDSAGNAYITDRDGAKAVVVTPDGATQTTIATGINTPAGITLDAAGNIYVAVIGSAEVEEYQAGTYTSTTLGSFVQPAFVALDSSGNVLVVDRGSNSIEQLTRATPESLSFATTSEGSTSSDSPQTVALTNDGNAPLVLSGLSTASTSFSVSGSSTCTSSTSLATNASCNIDVTFAPTVPGSPLTDALTITDNNLNAAGAVQTSVLSGTGTQQTATVTVAPVTISYTTDPTTLSAAVAYLGATAPSGTVSFTIDNGNAVPATCAGSSSPLTCTASYSTGTLSATTHTITATLAADTDFAATSGSATLTVTPIAPTISFAVANHTYGDAPVTLAATSNSGAPITYTVVSGPATVSGSTLTITGAGPVTVQAAQIAAGNYIAGTQNASFTIAQLALTAAIIGNPTKTYDGTTVATLTSANYQLTLLVGSDVITVTQPTGVYASATAGAEGVTAALSAANFSALPGMLSNYILPSVATGPGTINKATASVTPAVATKIYGTVDPSLTGTLSGFLAADNVTATYSRTAGEQVLGSPYSISAVLSPTAVLTNYNITYNTAAFTITPALASVTPATATKIYGTVDPPLTGTLSGFLAADNVTATYSRTEGANVGNYSTSAVLSPTGVLGNYNITYNTAPFTITPATLSATIVGSPTKSYDGTTTASLTTANYQLNGVVAGDSILVNQPVGAYAAATAGPESVTALLSASNFSAVSEPLTNYILPASATGPGTITKAVTSSTITWNTPAAIKYGTALSTAQLNASSTVAGSFSYTPPATTVLGAGTQTLNAIFTPTDTTDYLSGSASVTLQVNPATPTITWPTPAAITYGTALGAAQLNATASVAGTFSYSPASGVLTAGSQLLSVTFTPTDGTDYTSATSTVTLQVNKATPTITWPTPAAITYGTALGAAQLNATASVAGTFSYSPAGGVLTAGSQLLSVTFTPTDGTDYTTATSTVTLQVNKATPTITWPTPAAITYGTVLSGTQLNAAASVAGTYSYSPTSGTVLAAGPHTLSVMFTPTDTTDYTTATATVNIAVSPIALTITSGSPSMIYGSTLPTIAPSYNGFISGDSASSLTTQPTCTTTATSASNVGSYPTSCTGAVDANYIIGYKPGTLTITPAVLTVAANKLTFAYGGGDGDNDEDDVTNPMTYIITGFAPGQTAATDLTGKPLETSNTPEGGPVGSYTITMAAGSLKLKPAYSSNYTISYVSAPLTIVPAVLTVTATSQSDVYGGVDPDNCGHPERHLAYTITGFAYNQNQYQVLNGSPTETTTATAKSNVGTYPITITQGSLSLNRNYSSDYTLVFVNGTLTVTPANLYVVANSYSRQINQPNPAFSYTINGFVNGDTQTSSTTGSPACCSSTATIGSPAGIYPISIAVGSLAAKNGNYTLNFVNGALVVYNPRDRNDPHCDGFGNYRQNPQFDHDNWPDNSSYNFYWGNGGGGPNINNWNWQ
jgi:sugar lactone lactonase YvrE